MRRRRLRSWHLRAFLTLAALVALKAPSYGQSVPSPAPVPTQTPAPAPVPTQTPAQANVALQEEFAPKWDQASGSGVLLNVRGQAPFAIEGQQLFVRVKLPFVLSAPSNSVTGMSDSTVFFLALHQEWVLGTTISLPTGGRNSLGTGKYSIGPGFGYSARIGKLGLGFFSANYFSVMGPSSRSPVARSQIQPLIAYALPQGWSVGASTMNFTYNYIQGKWTSVPVGFRVDKRFGTGVAVPYTDFLRPLSANFEIEKNVTAVAGTPTWTYRATVRWTFPR